LQRGGALRQRCFRHEARSILSDVQDPSLAQRMSDLPCMAQRASVCVLR
jgi:hypothetical protein